MDNEDEEGSLCARCRKVRLSPNSASVVCAECARGPARPTPVAVEAIRTQQSFFMDCVDSLIEVYRTFDRSNRKAIKDGLKAHYERLQDLGTRLGIARPSLDHLWKG